MKQITLLSPAKVNLFLEVIKKRKDGYHEIATMFAKVGLSDRISVKKNPRKKDISLKIINKSGCKIHEGKDNLITKAATEFLSKFKISDGLDIKLLKHIPIGAGLGGGSSNAATTLRALCRLYDIKEHPSKNRKIKNIAKKLGADVPFFLYDETFAVAKGIGEKLRPIRVCAKLPKVVILFPGFSMPTDIAYAKIKYGDKRQVLTNLSRLHKLEVALKRSHSFSSWRHLLFNRLETSSSSYCNSVKLLCKKAGAVTSLMSGSGSCVYALVEEETQAQSLARKLKCKGKVVFVTGFSRRFREHGNNRDTHPPHE
jgi:4-diphosphocytidyl-2-C-methyl-D-erythritol kinase